MNYDDMSREQLIEIAKKAKDHEIKANPAYLAAIATAENRQAGIIEALRKENTELREQLEAIGAGGIKGKLMPGAVSAEPVTMPEGWKLVPVQPTEEMLVNVDEEVGGSCHSCSAWRASEDDCKRVWAAMIEASPIAPVAAQAQQPVSGADGLDERAEFEKAWTSYPGRKTPIRFDDGEYQYPAENTAWKFWQARAALARQDAVKGGVWQCTTTPQESDDLIWLYCQDTNTIDGPVKSNPEFIDAWTHWAWVEHPSTAALKAARKEQA